MSGALGESKDGLGLSLDWGSEIRSGSGRGLLEPDSTDGVLRNVPVKDFSERGLAGRGPRSGQFRDDRDGVLDNSLGC